MPGPTPRPGATTGVLTLLGGRLRWRLLGWLLLFSLLPILLSNTLGYLRSRGIIERLIESQVQSLAAVRAQQVHDALERELQALAAGNESMAAGVALASGREAGAMGNVANLGALERHLVRKQEELPTFDALFLLRADGEMVVHTGRRDDAAMRLPQATPFTLTFLPEPLPRLRLLVPVHDANRLTIGYLGGLIGTRGFALMFDFPPNSAEDIRSVVLDSAGQVIFPRVQVRYAASLLEADSNFAHYRDAAGEAVVGTVAPVPGTSWHYLAEAPVNRVLAPLLRLRRLSLGFALGLTFILLCTAWLVAGGIVAPVRRLVTATHQVGRGESNIRVRADGSDEIGELARAFNDMAARLETASASVRALHQREIERAQQLATVGELASGVAHEIKNPVVGITNGLDLVRRRLHGDATLDPILEEMTRQSKRIESAVRDLLSYARPAAPNLAAIDVAQLIERTTRLVQLAAEGTGVSVHVAVAPDAPAVHADAELLTQALVNLLLNALQATSAGGSVTLAALRDGETLRIVVADTGRGVPADDLEQIFKPFYTTRHAGTGLGLSITREIVERHGGRVEVDSNVGRGSQFSVVLPGIRAKDPVPSERVVA